MVVILLPVVAVGFVVSRPPPSLIIGQRAPIFALPLLDGAGEYGTSELRGSLVVVNVWASWCERCVIDARLLEDAWRRHRDDGLVVLGVSVDTNEEDAVAFVRRYGLSYPNVRDTGAVAGAFGLAGMPETYFIDDQLYVQSIYRGFTMGSDERHGVVLRDALYAPVLERRIAGLFAERAWRGHSARSAFACYGSSGGEC